MKYFILLIKCQNNFNKNTAPYSCKYTDTKYLSKTLSKWLFYNANQFQQLMYFWDSLHQEF